MNKVNDSRFLKIKDLNIDDLKLTTSKDLHTKIDNKNLFNMSNTYKNQKQPRKRRTLSQTNLEEYIRLNPEELETELGKGVFNFNKYTTKKPIINNKIRNKEVKDESSERKSNKNNIEELEAESKPILNITNLTNITSNNLNKTKDTNVSTFIGSTSNLDREIDDCDKSQSQSQTQSRSQLQYREKSPVKVFNQDLEDNNVSFNSTNNDNNYNYNDNNFNNIDKMILKETEYKVDLFNIENSKFIDEPNNLLNDTVSSTAQCYLKKKPIKSNKNLSVVLKDNNILLNHNNNNNNSKNTTDKFNTCKIIPEIKSLNTTNTNNNNNSNIVINIEDLLILEEKILNTKKVLIITNIIIIKIQ